jgi:hypothetical protein
MLVFAVGSLTNSWQLWPDKWWKNHGCGNLWEWLASLSKRPPKGYWSYHFDNFCNCAILLVISIGFGAAYCWLLGRRQRAELAGDYTDGPLGLQKDGRFDPKSSD